ncbi:MAG: GTPase Era [Hyphomicrobiales bacterium]|nr:GTPase Era [Hyphomicrobiales bacterium]
MVEDTPAALRPPDAEPTRCGFVAVIGAPNAGKSTLVNALVGAKVTIVSHKVQTTRARIRGIAMQGAAQLVLVDTPGIFAPKRRLDRAMVETAWGEAREADMVALLIDAAKGLNAETESILDGLSQMRGPRALVLNKVDRVENKGALLTLAESVTGAARFDEVFMISALAGSGVSDLRAYLAQNAPAGPWMFPEDQLSDAPLRLWAAEVTREKLFLRLHDELPYASTVETTDWKAMKDGSVRIEQTIFVERDSQKSIVLGKGGATVKEISMKAREEISQGLGTAAHLFLFVKVRDNWADDPERYREMGLEFPKT